MTPRERILNTAENLFYAYGIKSVGIDTIIREANVAKATFYYHFSSKDDLVIAFLKQRDEAWHLGIKEAISKLAFSDAEKPLAIFDVLSNRFDNQNYRGCAFINTMVEIADSSHPAHMTAAHHKRAVIIYIAELLALAGIKESATDALAYQFMLLIDGAIVTAVREGRSDAAYTAKKIAKNLLNHALTPTP